MTSCLIIHWILLMLCFNSFVLFVAACLKTLPADTARIPGQLDNTPLRRLPILKYSTHLNQFRDAKLFRTQTESAETKTSGDLTPTETENVPKPSHREAVTKNAKVFASKTDVRIENSNKEADKLEPVSELKKDDNNVRDDRDLFEALQVEKPGTYNKIYEVDP
uniref:Uncharacterized protein n=2 Tax=Caenorhabditis japonica TaxID=281687 RepID=A0A8R1E885_CAEJA